MSTGFRVFEITHFKGKGATNLVSGTIKKGSRGHCAWFWLASPFWPSQILGSWRPLRPGFTLT